MLSRILASFILIGALAVGLALFASGFGQPSYRENTEFAAGFSERAFKQVKEGASVDSGLRKLGKPIEPTVRESDVVFVQSRGVYERTAPVSILHYTRSRNLR